MIYLKDFLDENPELKERLHKTVCDSLLRAVDAFFNDNHLAYDLIEDVFLNYSSKFKREEENT